MADKISIVYDRYRMYDVKHMGTCEQLQLIDGKNWLTKRFINYLLSEEYEAYQKSEALMFTLQQTLNDLIEMKLIKKIEKKPLL